jgi:general secretion pathway protein D
MFRFICAWLLITLSAGVAWAQDKPGIRATDAGIVVDVQNADIRGVIAALAQVGHLNVIYNELPAKTVTLRINAPLARDEVKGYLKSVVESTGLILNDEGSVLRIVVPPPPPPPLPPAAPQGSVVQLFVYRLKHAPAARLAATLQALLGIAPGVPTPPGQGTGGSLSEDLRRQQLPSGITTPDGKAPLPAVTVLGGRVSGDVQIVADELTNSLLVRASQNDWRIMSNAIEALDLRPLQVLIEVLIAEVRRSSLFDLGLTITTPLQHESRTGGDIGGTLTGSTNGDVVLRILSLGRIQADLLISSMYSRSDVNILSRPVILAQNNQDARIMIGSERPFIQVFRSLPTDAGVRDQIVQYRDVGTSLKIRPTINYDGYVSLDILQEVSTATSEVQFGAPVISTREASTKLLVKDNQTAVIGGLIDRQQDRTRSGIPLLRDLPLLGPLFGSTHNNSIQTEMFIFITPHIVTTDVDMDRMREQVERNNTMLKKQLDKVQPLLTPESPAAPPE